MPDGRWPLVVVVVSCLAYPLWLETGHHPSMDDRAAALAYETGLVRPGE